MKLTDNKVKESARNYLRAHARFSMWDNHDDMRDEENWEHTFNFLTDRAMPVEDYIVKYLPDEVQNVKDEIMEEYGEEWEPIIEQFQNL